MKTTKIIFALIAMLLCSISANAHDFEVDGIYYNITSEEETVAVTFKGDTFNEFSDEYTGSVYIPESVSYNGTTYSVTSIGSGAFDSCSGLTSIEIPNSVTSIEDYAFFNCSGLTSVTIPNSVTSIEDNAFFNCSGLTSVTIGNSVKSIGDDAFYGCYSLTSVTIPNSVTSIGSSAFYDCYGLTSVTIPNSVTSIGSGAFIYCSGLTSVTIGNSVKSIGSWAFEYCSGLTSIEIPNSVTSIGSGAFYNCSGLTSIVVEDGNAVYDSRNNCNAIIETSTDKLIVGCRNTIIPNTVTSIGDNAFFNCSGLTSVTIPNSVTSIGDYAFFNCSGLTSVTIPNSVTSIGGYAFYFCVSLTSIVVEDGNAVYDSRNNCNAIIETSTDKLIVGCRNTIIPNTVTSIGDDAFNCSGLTSVSIPNSVTEIGRSAFYACSGLTSVTIPNSVTSIGDDAFSDCPNLKEATVGCKWKENPVYTFDSNVTVNATLHSYTDGICTECGHAVIIDGAVTEYSVAVERACPITYTRTFNNTEWQALYVPFAMSYDDWKEDFDVAKINDIHQFDVNNDGDFDDAEDKTIMEMLKVNNGTLKANHPYMIRAKSTGEKSITIENATLMPTEVNSIDCSSVERKYVFTGTYKTIDGKTMVNNKYYAMSGGGVKYTTNTSVSLKPFRWYMQIMDRDGQLLESATEIKVVVSGEDDWDVTGIESVKDGDGTFKVYSIGGVLVRSVKAADIKQATEGLPKGLYIVNGKKCNVR